MDCFRVVRFIVLGLVLLFCIPLQSPGWQHTAHRTVWRASFLVSSCRFVFLSGRRYWCSAHRLDMKHFIVLGLVFHFVLVSSSQDGGVLCIVFACLASLFLVSSCCFVLLSGSWVVVYCALR